MTWGVVLECDSEHDVGHESETRSWNMGLEHDSRT